MIVHRVPQSDHVGVQIQDKSIKPYYHTAHIRAKGVLKIFFNPINFFFNVTLWFAIVARTSTGAYYYNDLHINHSNYYNAQIPMQYIVYM